MLLGAAMLSVGCRTPATKVVIERPWEEVRAGILAFTKAHEAPAVTNVESAQLLGYTKHAIAFPPPTMDLRPSDAWSKEYIRVTESIEKQEDGVFRVAFIPVMPLMSFGTLRTEIKARRLGPGSTELSVHSCLHHGSLFCRTSRQRPREEQTLTDVQESMRVLFVRP